MVWLRKFVAVFAAFAAPALSQDYKMVGSIPIGGAGGWDYLAADSQNRRLYVSHGTEVVVIDLDSRKIVGRVPGMKRIHGIAIANDANVGYITDGGADQAVVFDLKSLAVKQRVSTGKNPDAVCYDPTSHYIFTMNGGSQDSTVIDARSGEVVKTIPLGGKPEFAASDGKGSVYVNLEDKNQLARLDVKQMAVSAQWPLGACDSPSGLAIDRQNRRLFSVCDNKIMTVVDADSGKVVATPAIGEGPDAAAFDPGNHVALSSNGRSGTLTVVREDSADQFTVAQTVQTERGARTMTVDEKSHNIYLVTAKFGPAPPVSPSNPRPRPVIQPDSFKVLIVGQ